MEGAAEILMTVGPRFCRTVLVLPIVWASLLIMLPSVLNGVPVGQ